MAYRLPFLGLDFDPMTASEAAHVMAQRARKLGPFAYVTTPNVDHMVRLDREPDLKSFYKGGWLTLCDSRILELFAQASDMRLPAAPGADIVETLFRQHITPYDRVVVIGGTQRIADTLRSQFGLRDLCWFDAPAGLKHDAAARAQCVEFIRNNPAPFVFLAVGSPQQEIIAQETRASGACSGVAICCGASLEFLTGEVRRAPKWMRANRLEWLYRLASEPHRLWKRYLIDGPRIFVVWSKWRNAPQGASVPATGVAVSS